VGSFDPGRRHAETTTRDASDRRDTHLDSGKPSRAAPAAHYCAIVAELSSLLGEPALWTDLLRHLKHAHARKRLIWQRLRTEGCPVD